MSEFRLPELGAAGPLTVGRWLKRPGDSVAAGEPLLEVFSERFDWDILAPAGGELKAIVAADGAAVSAGAVLAMIDGAAAAGTAAPAAGDALQAEHTAAAGNGEAAARAPRVSPLAARIAADRQIDLEWARGSGPDGRVNKDDVLAMLGTSAEVAASRLAAEAPPGPAEQPAGARVQTVTAFIAVDMAHAAVQRAARGAHWQQREGFELGYLPFIVMATAAALRAAPLDGWSERHHPAAVIEVVQAGGMVALRGADGLNLVGIARRLHGARAERDPQAGHAEAERPAFIIEDHGAHGALLATGLLPPGAAGLLSAGSVHQQAVAIGEALQTRPVAYLGLTYDPRAVDEGRAGKFMAELKRLLEAGSFS